MRFFFFKQKTAYEIFKQQCIKRMTVSFPTGLYENWAICQRLFAHVQVVLKYTPAKDMMEEWATLLYRGGWYAWSQGRYDIAEQMASKSRKALTRKLGGEDAATLASISLFASVIGDRGRW